MKRFSDLSEQEVLALAITNEEEDSRIYRGFAEGLREQFPSSAKVFDEMAEEEVHHRTMLFDLYRKKFGDYLPLIRRQDVKGFLHPKQPLWLTRPLGLEEVRKFAENMEFEAERYYRKAAENARDASVRQLLVELAEAEAGHESLAHKLSQEILTTGALAKEEETARRMFVLQYVQPGLAGLMDGSVSTLAPLFAAAFATHSTWETFLVGMAASVGAGISMGFAEALSDDGSLTGRGAPLLRGTVCGVMTAIGGARSHSAFPHSRFLCRDRRRDPCGGGRTGGNLLDPHPLHGHAVPAGGIPGGCRRCARVYCGHLDREFMIPHQGTDADPRASFRPASRTSAGAALERADRQAGDRIH